MKRFKNYFKFLLTSYDVKANIVKLSDSNKIRTHNHIVHKQTLNHSAKLALIIELCCE